MFCLLLFGVALVESRARRINAVDEVVQGLGLPLVGTLPAFLAWMGLWWAQYPADRAFKEQSVLYHANEGLPIHAPPRV